MGAEGVGDGLRASAGNGPADGVGSGAEGHGEARAERLVETEEGVRGEAGEEGFGASVAEKMQESGCGRQRGKAEACKQERVSREHAEGTEDFWGEFTPMFGEWLEEAAPGFGVFTEPRLGGAQIALEGDSSTVVEGVGERRG